MTEFLIEFADFCFQIFLISIIVNFFISLVKSNLESRVEQHIEILEKFNELVHRVRVEEHNNVFYWFDDDNDEFLAQGQNIDEATERLKARFPGHIFFITNKEVIYRLSAPEWQLVKHEHNK